MKTKYVSIPADGNEIEPIIEAVRDFLARGAERVEIVATTRGAVSHCDIEVQDEPMWQVRGEFPQVQAVLAQQSSVLFTDEEAAVQDLFSGRRTIVFGDTAAKAHVQTGRDIITAIDAGAEYSVSQTGSYINVLSGSDRDGEGYPDRTYNGKATVRCGELSYTLNTTAPDIADADILAVLRYQVA